MQVIGANMKTRKPIVAGQFYPDGRDACLEEIQDCISAGTLSRSLPEEIFAGIVPHAGWFFSGSIATLVFSAIKKRRQQVHTFVIFGTAHRYSGTMPAIDDSDFWETPLGNVAVDLDLAAPLVKKKVAVLNPQAHKGEHSIEVQVPFIKHLFPDAKILPIIVPPAKEAIALGEAVGDVISAAGKTIVCIGSTDLTHYGPLHYGFTPMGTGPEALRWASEVNDRKFIDLAIKMDAQGLLASAAENCNACGPGAAAATIAAAKKLGKTKGTLLAHTNSNDVMQQKMGTSSSDSVGYAAIVF
jgi:AmmeMemoRadiSam system protein B